MPIKFRENGSIKGLAKRVSKLEGAVQQLTKAVRYDVGRDATNAPVSSIRQPPTGVGDHLPEKQAMPKPRVAPNDEAPAFICVPSNSS